MGVERNQPIINDHSLALNFTNELGAAGTIRFLKNIAGLWLLQECRRAWALAGREYSYEELSQRAAAAQPAGFTIDPDAFPEPDRMPDRIAEYCRAQGHPAPEQPGAMSRLILESLATTYRNALDNLETLLTRLIHPTHTISGGSPYQPLNTLS